jgi:hypothetical protein
VEELHFVNVYVFGVALGANDTQIFKRANEKEEDITNKLMHNRGYDSY